jgi:hypothetical protein
MRQLLTTSGKAIFMAVQSVIIKQSPFGQYCGNLGSFTEQVTRSAWGWLLKVQARTLLQSVQNSGIGLKFYSWLINRFCFCFELPRKFPHTCPHHYLSLPSGDGNGKLSKCLRRFCRLKWIINWSQGLFSKLWFILKKMLNKQRSFVK